jgi:hypothetical protein
MNLNKHLHWIIYIVFFTSCARQSSPTGGPKDTIPPILIGSIPRNETVNFKEKTIELTFSETVILNNPKEQIIITPTAGKKYEIKTKKNKVVLTLENNLEDSTTYTFNFREAIQDINEKNPAKNLQLALSTGTYIDSLSIEGTVYDYIKDVEFEDAIVAIHEKNDTFSILKHPATYFTKSDEKGIFKISHLKSSTYYIYAIDDKNKNLVADTKSEFYGFKKDSIVLTNNIKKLSLGLIFLDARPLKFNSSRPYNTYFNIKTSKNIKRYELTSPDSLELYSCFGEDQANIRLYNNLGQRDSIQLKIVLHDSIGNSTDTIMFAKFNTRDVTPEKFSYEIKETFLHKNKGILNASILFSKPLKEFNTDSIIFKIDSTKSVTITPEDLNYDEPHRTLAIQKEVDVNLFIDTIDDKDTIALTDSANHKPAKPKLLYELYLGKGAFISIEQDSSKVDKETIKPVTQEDLAIIQVQISTNKSHYIVELLSKNYTLLKTIKNQSSLKFEDLQPGEYLIRVISDDNKNGEWDPGNYLLRKEPEVIKYYKSEKGLRTIPVKADWDVGPMLITL